MKTKRIVSLFIPMLLIASLLAFIPQVKAGTLKYHREITSPNRIFLITVDIYQSQENLSYIGFDILVTPLGDNPWLFDSVALELIVPGSSVNDYVPKNGTNSESINLTPAGPQITFVYLPSVTVSAFNDKSLGRISWTTNQPDWDEFAAAFTDANTPFCWALNVTASTIYVTNPFDPVLVHMNETAKFSSAFPWDINHDGIIDVTDIGIAAKAFMTTSGDPNWNAEADVNGVGIIDITDIAMIAQHFMETY